MGIALPPLKIKRHAFGCAVITNVSMLNAETVYAPFPTVLRVSSILVVSSIKEEPCVVDGEVVMQQMLPLLCTFDHRFVNEFTVANVLEELKRSLENPEELIK